MTACSSAGDADEAVAPTVATSITPATTTTTSTVPESDCRAVAEHAASLLQTFVDDYDTLTVAEWNALDPPPDLADVRDQVVQLAQSAVNLGCDPTTMEAMLIDSIDELSAEGAVGGALAAAFRGDDPIFGPPAPVLVTTTTIARETEPSTVMVQSGQDLGPVLARIAPGSTVEFAAGTHTFTEPIVVDIDVTFVGAGRDDTIISSSAEGFAVAFIGPGGFEARDLTIEHTGPSSASVLLTLEGPVLVENAVIRGATAGPEDPGGGHGIVFAFEPLEGFPQRSAAERAGILSVQDSVITGNRSAGILVTGDASPQISGATISNNGSCGLCYAGTSSGTVTNSTLDGNVVGVQIGDDAKPNVVDAVITNNTSTGISIDGRSTASIATSLIDANPVGVQVGGEAAPVLNDNTVTNSDGAGVVMIDASAPRVISNLIEYNGEVGVQIGGSSSPIVESNTISHHGVGVLAAQTAAPSLSSNGIAHHDIGIQVGGDARAEVIENTIWVSAVAAISLTESGIGVVRDNSIADAPELGIQAVGNSSAEIIGNTIESAGSIGISLIGNASGTVATNEVSDRRIGVQVGGSAAPDITGNTVVRSVEVGITFADASSGRATENDVSGAGAVGVLVGGTATPDLQQNKLTGNAVGMLFTADARGAASFNTVEFNSVGVQAVGQSAPFVDGNRIADNVDAGVVFAGASSARFERNTVLRNGEVALEVTGTAAPAISGNEIRGAGVYGIIYRDSTAGVLAGNQIVDHVYGVQLQGSAAPDLTDNTLEKILLTSIVYIDSSGGSASGNSCSESLGGGITVSAPADPTLGENDCRVSDGG